MADSDAWDADDFEPELPSRPQQNDDKWEGEDQEDDTIKDNWEDEEEEKKDGSVVQAYQRPKKKPLGGKIAEREAKEKKEAEEKKAKQKEERVDMTPEERQAEKIRLKKIQEDENLSLAKGLFAMPDESVDKMMPTTEGEFDQLREALKSKIQFFEASGHYKAFLLQLIGDLSLTLGAEDVKKLGIAVNSLYHEKERQRKETEKKKKKKTKASLKVSRTGDLDFIGDAGEGDYYDDDDFI